MLYRSLRLFTSSLLGQDNVQDLIDVKCLGTKSICPQAEENEEERSIINKHRKRKLLLLYYTMFPLWSVDGTVMGTVVGQLIK